MKYFTVTLKNALAEIADALLPRFSGQNKILEVVIRMDYDNNRFQHVKVVFWHPNNYMLVGYDFETHAADLFGDYTVTANHDSTWKEDGLDFFSKILEDPNETTIVSAEVLLIEELVFTDSDQRKFNYKYKK